MSARLDSDRMIENLEDRRMFSITTTTTTELVKVPCVMGALLSRGARGIRGCNL